MCEVCRVEITWKTLLLSLSWCASPNRCPKYLPRLSCSIRRGGRSWCSMCTWRGSWLSMESKFEFSRIGCTMYRQRAGKFLRTGDTTLSWLARWICCRVSGQGSRQVSSCSRCSQRSCNTRLEFSLVGLVVVLAVSLVLPASELRIVIRHSPSENLQTAPSFTSWMPADFECDVNCIVRQSFLAGTMCAASILEFAELSLD